MNCPHCNYERGMRSAEQNYEWIDGKKGEFWKHHDTMIRYTHEPHEQSYRQETNLYACPSCGKTFIEVD